MSDFNFTPYIFGTLLGLKSFEVSDEEADEGQVTLKEVNVKDIFDKVRHTVNIDGLLKHIENTRAVYSFYKTDFEDERGSYIILTVYIVGVREKGKDRPGRLGFLAASLIIELSELFDHLGAKGICTLLNEQKSFLERCLDSDGCINVKKSDTKMIAEPSSKVNPHWEKIKIGDVDQRKLIQASPKNHLYDSFLNFFMRSFVKACKERTLYFSEEISGTISELPYHNLVNSATLSKAFNNYIRDRRDERAAQLEESNDLKEQKKSLDAKVQSLKEKNESLRVENESLRVENESLRVENESLRVENESLPVKNESLRVENESSRVKNESLRVENENLVQQYIRNDNNESLFSLHKEQTFSFFRVAEQMTALIIVYVIHTIVSNYGNITTFLSTVLKSYS